jgi:hypothetical protein
MTLRRSRPAPGRRPELESLEGRVVLSFLGYFGGTHHAAAQVAGQTPRGAATQTSLAVTAGTLGQPITFTVTVKAPAAAGVPAGTVSITDRGSVLHTLTLAPTPSTNPKVALSQATLIEAAQPGGPAFFFGKHTVGVSYVPTGGFSRSSASKTFTVSQPAYTDLANGVKYAIVAPGSGPQIQAGQTAEVLYTGFLARTGQLFDDSLSHGGTPLSFAVGAGQMIPGFDAGTAGMREGETRIIQVPASQGYGATANGAIPANSTLTFLVTLHGIA